MSVYKLVNSVLTMMSINNEILNNSNVNIKRWCINMDKSMKVILSVDSLSAILTV